MKRIRLFLLRTLRTEVAAGICTGLLIGGAGIAIAMMESGKLRIFAGRASSRPASIRTSPLADAGGASLSRDVRYMAEWIAATRDAGGFAFVIVDKKDARVYVFDSDARLRGASPVLLGGAIGDESVPDIGSRPIAEVLPQERTTPAGRFVGERGHDARGEDVVWVDYDAAVSMHRVLTTNPSERRLERLATPTSEDNRISYGCINVPVSFYEEYVRPTFARQRAIVYVLPELKSIEQVFGAYDVGAARAPVHNRAPPRPGPGDPSMLPLVMHAG